MTHVCLPSRNKTRPASEQCGNSPYDAPLTEEHQPAARETQAAL
jgi:hypothetical protein